jgi:lipopolysaccharide heptosyltransferase II
MKILVINPFGIGDVLFSTPVVSALKKKFPGCYLGYICNRQSAPILENNPDIDRLFFFSRGDFKKIKKQSFWAYLTALIKAFFELRRLKFDLVVDLSMVSQYSFMLRLAGVRQIAGFDYKPRGRFLHKKIQVKAFENKHVIDHYADLLTLIGINDFQRELKLYLAPEDQKWAGQFLQEKNIENDDLLIGVAPFGGLSWGKDAQNKQWPVDSYAEVIKSLIDSHKAKVVFFGTKNDLSQKNILDQIVGKKKYVNAIGKTSLSQLAALIDRCDLFISNDSGPMHMACALNKNTVSVFGPVNEKVYGPVGDSAQHIIACADIDCRPCYKDFKKPECDRMDCLRLLDKEKVLSLVQRALSGLKKTRNSKFNKE